MNHSASWQHSEVHASGSPAAALQRGRLTLQLLDEQRHGRRVAEQRPQQRVLHVAPREGPVSSWPAALAWGSCKALVSDIKEAPRRSLAHRPRPAGVRDEEGQKAQRALLARARLRSRSRRRCDVRWQRRRQQRDGLLRPPAGHVGQHPQGLPDVAGSEGHGRRQPGDGEQRVALKCSGGSCCSDGAAGCSAGAEAAWPN